MGKYKYNLVSLVIIFILILIFLINMVYVCVNRMVFKFVCIGCYIIK